MTTRALTRTPLPGIPYLMTRYGEAIRERREWVGYPTATALAQASEELERRSPDLYRGFSQSSLSRWELDTTGAYIEAAHGKALRTLAHLLKWGRREFEAHVGIPVGRVPGYDEDDNGSQASVLTAPVSGGITINVYEAGTGPAWGDNDVLARIFLPGLRETRDGEYIGLKAMGDSMTPYLNRGDIAVVLRDDGAVQPGDYCAVWLADDGCVIKRFVQELPDGLLLLESLNPSSEEARFFPAPLGSRVLGKVVRRALEG